MDAAEQDWRNAEALARGMLLGKRLVRVSGYPETRLDFEGGGAQVTLVVRHDLWLVDRRRPGAIPAGYRNVADFVALRALRGTAVTGLALNIGRRHHLLLDLGEERRLVVNGFDPDRDCWEVDALATKGGALASRVAAAPTERFEMRSGDAALAPIRTRP